MDKATQECPGGDDHRGGGEFTAVGELDSPQSTTIGNPEFVSFTFNHNQVGRFPDRSLHRSRIELAVGLRARAPNGRTLATIEHAKLNATGVGHSAH